MWAGVLLATCIAAPLVYRFTIQEKTYNDIKAQADQADLDATAVETTEQNTKNKLAEIAPLQAKVDFVKDIQFYNKFPGLVYRNVARYTYRGVEYNSMAVQGDSLSVNAFVPKLEDVGRFYLTLFGNPDIKALSIKGMPDWRTMQAMKQLPPDARRGFPVQVSAQLIHNVTPPSAPAGGAGGGMGGFPGGGGMPPGMMSGSLSGSGMPPGGMGGKGGAVDQ
ncbi:hypothetical protein [Armatimonas rosea]|uniref:Uncharacterized protein n=1 Tax=Armatimonas rosea TaxID=685828 RepID=A0A7W9W610_ARMRO|nr:hypothetical protein [Armatimonas rosea]MBB6049515.1 hypothetical protein [Armatimonas rosea]